MRPATVLLLSLLTACSGPSAPTHQPPPEGMRCIKAHQELHDERGWLRRYTICDAYSPLPEASP